MGWGQSTGAVVLRDESVNLVERTYYNFIGAGVTATDDPTNLETEVTIPGVSGSQVVTRRSVATPYTVLSDDYELWVTSAGTVTIPAAQNTNGRKLIVKNESSGTVVLAPASGQIEDAASYSLLVQNEVVAITGDGTNWGRAD